MPGPLKSRAPSTRRRSAKIVLPNPDPPAGSVDRPWGKPTPVSPPYPTMPLAVFLVAADKGADSMETPEEEYGTSKFTSIKRIRFAVCRGYAWRCRPLARTYCPCRCDGWAIAINPLESPSNDYGLVSRFEWETLQLRASRKCWVIGHRCGSTLFS